MGTGAEIALLALAAGSTVATIESSNQQRRLAGQAKNRAESEQKKQEATLLERQKKEEGQRAMLANRERSRMMRAGQAKDTRGGTLLTSYGSPTGAQASNPAANKTMLGT